MSVEDGRQVCDRSEVAYKMGTLGCISEPGKIIADSSEWIGPAAQDVSAAT